MKKPATSIDEYRELAVKLAAIHDELVHLDVELANKTAKKLARRWRTAMALVCSKLQLARLRLEDLACAQHGTDAGMSACSVGQPRPAIRYDAATECSALQDREQHPDPLGIH